MLVKPLLRGHFHQAMFFISIGACTTLLFQSSTPLQWLAISIYSLGVLTMFGISALYHRITWSPEKRILLKKLDHAGIYVMIAGTFTPIALLALNETSATKLLWTIWIVTAVGIVQSIFFVNLPKIVSSCLYLVAGYLVLPYIGEIKNSIGPTNAVLIIAGGLTYSVGALAYGLKRPVLNPQIFGYHEVFHVLVSIAAILHFIVIDSLV